VRIPELERALRTVTRRLRLTRALDRAARAGAWATLAGCGLAGLQVVGAAPPALANPWAVALPPAAAALLAAAWSLRRPIPAGVAAGVLERRTGAGSLYSTALELAPDAAWGGAVRAEVEAALAGADPRRAAPLRLPRLRGLAAGLAAAVGVALLPPWPGPAEATPEREVVALEGDDALAVSRLGSRLRRTGAERDLPALQEAARRLAAFGEDAGAGRLDALEALARLGAVEEELRRERERVEARIAARRRLASDPALTELTAGGAAPADAEEREGTRIALERAAEAARGDPELAAALDRAAEALRPDAAPAEEAAAVEALERTLAELPPAYADDLTRTDLEEAFDELERLRETVAASPPGEGGEDPVAGPDPTATADPDPPAGGADPTPTVDPSTGGAPLGDGSDAPAGDSSAGDSSADEPPAGEPSADESKADEPPAGEPSAGESPADEPPAGEPSAGESPAGEPSAGESPAGEPSAGESPADEPPVGEPSADELPGDESPAGEPSAGESPAGKPSAGESPADEPPAGEEPPADEPPAPDQPAATPPAPSPLLEALGEELVRGMDPETLRDLMEAFADDPDAGPDAPPELPPDLAERLNRLDPEVLDKLMEAAGGLERPPGPPPELPPDLAEQLERLDPELRRRLEQQLDPRSGPAGPEERAELERRLEGLEPAVRERVERAMATAGTTPDGPTGARPEPGAPEPGAPEPAGGSSGGAGPGPEPDAADGEGAPPGPGPTPGRGDPADASGAAAAGRRVYMPDRTERAVGRIGEGAGEGALDGADRHLGAGDEEAYVPFAEVPADVRRAAEESLARQQVPEPYERVVRDYFGGWDDDE